MARLSKGDFYRKSHHKLAMEIRLRTRGTKPKRDEVLSVLDEIGQSQEVPEGWEVAMIRWSHAGEGSSHWRRGDISDLGGQLQQVWPVLMEHIRSIGIDRAKSRGDVWEIVVALKY